MNTESDQNSAAFQKSQRPNVASRSAGCRLFYCSGKVKRTVFFLIVAGFITACANPAVEVEISRETIQQKVDKKFPLQKSILVARVSLHSPKVYLASKKVGLKLSFDANIFKKEIAGTLDVKGALYFDKSTGQFFVQHLELQEVQVDDASFAAHDQLRILVGQVITTYLDDYPVYTLPREDFKKRIMGKFLKSVEVRDGVLVATFAP